MMVQSKGKETLFGEAEKVEKRRREKGEPVFKRYEQNQTMLLPPSMEELIPEKHLVRVVNSTIDGLKIDALLSTYEGGRASAYHPLMMLKVLVYAYVSKVYSSRMIAKAVREDVNFMWLSGMNRPDFRTINRFRSGRLKKVIDEVFGRMTKLLVEHGYVDLEKYFVDGTKVRADNNKHKVVWKKNTKRYKENVQERIKGLLREIEEVNKEENERYGDRDFEELGEESDLTSEDVKEEIERINGIIKDLPKKDKKAKAVREIETKLTAKLEKYEEQEKTLAGRNSYAKTDTDATVFMMKDGQLLPAYNVIIGTQNQFILSYNFHQRKASESDALIGHLQHGKKIIGRYPSVVVGDSAYGSEENYAFLEEAKIGNYLKYNTPTCRQAGSISRRQGSTGTIRTGRRTLHMTMRECFYYSNMCPQTPSLNRGAWKNLEEYAERWQKSMTAYLYGAGRLIFRGGQSDLTMWVCLTIVGR